MIYLNPTTSFAGLTELPKHWGFNRCQLAPFTSNPCNFLADGLQFTAPNYPGKWFGLAAGGWHYPTTAATVSPDFDIELEYKDFDHTFDRHSFAIGVRIPGNSVADCLDITADVFLVVMVLRDSGQDKVRFSQSVTGTIQTVVLPDITDGKLRLTRVGDVFTGYYDIGHGSWQAFGTTWNAANDARFKTLKYRLDPIIRCTRLPAQAYAGVTVVSFAQNIGSPLPEIGVDTPSDDFEDGVLPTQPKWSGATQAYCGGMAPALTEIDGYIQQYISTASSVNNWINPSNYALFPGTDIDLTVDMSLHALDGWKNQGVYFFLCAHTLTEDRNVWVGVVLRRSGSTTVLAQLAHGYAAAGVYSGVEVGTAIPSRHTFRLTRVGSDWAAYLDGSPTPFATLADPVGYLSNSPLTPELYRYQYTGTATLRHYDFNVIAGDYDPRLDVLAPWLVSGPTSPNEDYYQSVPMEWETADDHGPITIDSLIINGYNAVLSNIVQSGFTGTVTVNGSNGISVSLLADEMYFIGTFPWVLTFSDAAGYTTVETGTITGPLIPPPGPSPTTSGFLIESSSILPVELEEEDYSSDIHPVTKRMLTGFEWDNLAWPDEEKFRHRCMVPSIYDPLFSGISEDYWQAGVGGGEDLSLRELSRSLTSGILNSSAQARVGAWIPRIQHGHFFLGPERFFLHGDDSRYLYPSFDEVLSGIGWSPGSGLNFLGLTPEPKPGAEISARQYQWDEEENKYKTYIRARKKGFFTGLRDEDSIRLSTYSDDLEAILFHNIDPTNIEFVTHYSGIPRTRYLVFNQQVSTQQGEYEVGSGEFLGYATGQGEEIFHTMYSPIDRTVPLRVTSYLGNSGIYQDWEVVSGITNLLSGYQVGVDFDFGLLKFPHSGLLLQEGVSVEASYFKTFEIEYEPSETVDTIECLAADCNPARNHEGKGFVLLTDEGEEAAEVTLEVENLNLISDILYGPLNLGNSLAKLVATVYDRQGNPLEGKVVNFEILTMDAPGTFQGAETTSTSLSNHLGKARAFYRSPSSIGDIGEYITANGTINNSPSYVGVTQTTTFQTEKLALLSSIDDVSFFKVWTDDPILGYRDPSTPDDASSQLKKYYEDFFTTEEVYGPTGLDLGGSGPSTYAAEWEATHRQIWDLLRPVLYTGAEGKKILVVKEDNNSIDPHVFNSSAIAPFKPIDIVQNSETSYDLVFDTSDYVLPNPGSGTFASYFVVAPIYVEFRAYVYSSVQKQYVYSNVVRIKLTIPDHMNGTWLIDNLNEVDLSEISRILAAKDSSDILNKNLIFGFRLESDNITLAGALGGITFLDVNSVLSPNKWPALGHKFTVSGII